MDNINRIQITTQKQFEKLVELMEKNPHLAKGYKKSLYKFDIKDEWNKVGKVLNKHGPPLRDGEGWKKVWADFKFKLRKKVLHNKAECRATGGGPFKQYILTPTEEAAYNLLELSSLLDPGEEIGLKRRLSVSKQPEQNDVHVDTSSSDESLHENEQPSTSQHLTSQRKDKNKNKSDESFHENEEPSTSHHLISQRKGKTKKNEKNDLLSEQLKVQTQLYTELKRSLADIERYSRKTYELKKEKLKLYKEELKKKQEDRKLNEKKFKLYKEELKSKQEDRKSLIQIRLDEIVIKKRKIELEEIRSGF